MALTPCAGTKDEVTIVETGQLSNSSQEKIGTAADDVDEAYKFLVSVNISEEEIASTDLKRIQRKIDSRMVPIMLAGYFFTFVDKVLLNVCRHAGRPVNAIADQSSMPL